MLFCFLSSRVNRKRELFKKKRGKKEKNKKITKKEEKEKKESKKTKREGNVVAITGQGREDGGEGDISGQEHCPFS